MTTAKVSLHRILKTFCQDIVSFNQQSIDHEVMKICLERLTSIILMCSESNQVCRSFCCYAWNNQKKVSCKGGSTVAETSKMERFVIIVNGFQPLTITTKRSILDVAAVLHPPLCCVQWICSARKVIHLEVYSCS